MINLSLKNKVISLRESGKTYSEINRDLAKPIPKSTLSYWCKNINLSYRAQKRISKIAAKKLAKNRELAVKINRIQRAKHLAEIKNRNSQLAGALSSHDTAKIALSILYLGEGSKTQKGSLVFGNSSPFVVSLFLYLLRFCYTINEDKFRCTVQCRADQDVAVLEQYWSQLTRIPLSQFYNTRIDPRTVSKPSKKEDYKGVCRIDYFSAEIFNELIQIPKIIYMGP